MARLNTGERKTIRNAAIAGATVATIAAVAAYGTRRMLRERAVRPTLAVDWSGETKFTQAPEGERVDFTEYTDKGLKHHLAVLSLNSAELEARLQENPGGSLAVTVVSNEGGWHTGLFRGAAEERLSSSPRDAAQKVVALRLGNQALDGGVYLGVIGGDGGFNAVKTEVEDVGPVGLIKREYQDISIMTSPPEDLISSADKQRYIPVTDVVAGATDHL